MVKNDIWLRVASKQNRPKGTPILPCLEQAQQINLLSP